MTPGPVPDFPAWAGERADARFSDWLRASAQPEWDAVINHRFADELADGVLDRRVMARYLVQDYTFLDAFVVLMASAIATAPTLDDRLPLGRFLGMVTSDENTYFQRAFTALGVSDEDRILTPVEPTTRDFQEIMREAAAGGAHANMIAVLLVTEWTYYGWAHRVSDRRPEPFWLAEWIDLHAGAPLRTLVEALRAQIDRDGPELSHDARAECLDYFKRATALERAFFDMAYEV